MHLRNTTNRPNVDLDVVVDLADEQLRRSVPASGDILGERLTVTFGCRSTCCSRLVVLFVAIAESIIIIVVLFPLELLLAGQTVDAILKQQSAARRRGVLIVAQVSRFKGKIARKTKVAQLNNAGLID